MSPFVPAVELQSLLGDPGGSLGAVIQIVLTIVLPVVFLTILYFVVKAAVKKGMKEVMAEKDRQDRTASRATRQKLAHVSKPCSI